VVNADGTEKKAGKNHTSHQNENRMGRNIGKDMDFGIG